MPHLRARFSGDAPVGYRRLNRGLPGPGETGAATSSPRIDDLDGLDSTVKIHRLALELSEETRTGAIAEMAGLQRDGLLAALRGERPTDLARPVDAATSRRIRSTCPHLSKALDDVERLLAGTDLFVRAVKYDRARASSTEPSPDRGREHLHFDAELSSLDEYDEPVFQFYLNLGTRPRQFRILPVPLAELLAQLVDRGALDPGATRTTQLREILDLYRHHFAAELEVIPVESLCLAVFDGRTFAHDAGKADMTALLEGSMAPADEDDLVLALDTRATGHHRGLYDPSRPFLDDLES